VVNITGSCTYCDENETIVFLLKNVLKPYLKSPILDVGAGIGDIAFKALAGEQVIMIDVNNSSQHDYPCRPEHSREKCDFFEFSFNKKINTVLISHTLQFIDDDVEKLNGKILELNPENVIVVLNSNNDFMGKLIKWSEENFERPNPEKRIPSFPRGYHLIKSEPFTATLKCSNYSSLAKQVSYLMLIEMGNIENLLVDFLKNHLVKPEFTFNQSIEIYSKI
jgi:hypothetical protein